MTDISSLQTTFDCIKRNSDPSARIEFGVALLHSNAPEYLDYHYHLLELNDCDAELFALICRKFGQRGDAGESYLSTRIETETSDRVRATVLQILGGFKYTKGKCLGQTAQLARSFLDSSNPELRLRALWVIGWLGGSTDFAQLAEVLRSDPEPKNRGSAATAMMQIFFNDKSVATDALAHLKGSLMSEADLGALEEILISIQEISGEKLGLNASTHKPTVKAQVERAKRKAESFFSSDARL